MCYVIDGTKEITDILNEYLEKFDCVAEIGTDFAYLTESNTVRYALLISDSHKKTFMAFLNKLFPEIEADPFLWSFYHEIGHHETEDDFTDEEEEEYREIASSGISDEEYYNLPMEYEASVWAGNYMKTHQKEVSDLWNKLQPAIKDFYRKMEVE